MIVVSQVLHVESVGVDSQAIAVLMNDQYAGVLRCDCEGNVLTMLVYIRHKAVTDLRSEMMSKGSGGASFVLAIRSLTS